MCRKRPTTWLPLISWRVSKVLHCRWYPTNGGRLFGTVTQRGDVSWLHLQLRARGAINCFMNLLLIITSTRWRAREDRGRTLSLTGAATSIIFVATNTSFVASSIILSRQNAWTPQSLHPIDPFRLSGCRTATTNQSRLQSSTTPPKRTLGGTCWHWLGAYWDMTGLNHFGCPQTQSHFQFIQSVYWEGSSATWLAVVIINIFPSRGEPGWVGVGAIRSCDASARDPPVCVCLWGLGVGYVCAWCVCVSFYIYLYFLF